MASIRRNTAAMPRNGSGRNLATSMVRPTSPKVACSRASLAVGRFVNSWVPADFVFWLSKLNPTCIFTVSGRNHKPQERCRTKGLSWKRILFNLFAFFMVGVIIGSTPFFTIDISQSFASENERFPSGTGKAASSSEEKLAIAQKEVESNGTMEYNNSNSGLKDVEQIDKQQTDEMKVLPHEEFNLDVKHQSDGQKSVALQEEMELDEELSKTEIPVIRWEMKNDSRNIFYAAPPFNDSDIVIRKLLIVVTATSVRPLQAYYLTRLSHVLKSVEPPLLWVVSEWPGRTLETAEILRGSGLMYRHVMCDRNLTSLRKIAVCQKNIALFLIKKHRLDGVVHFADENTVYSSDLFEEMRVIRRFGAWPVAIQADTRDRAILEGPLCRGNQVVGWQANQRRASGRRFPIGFSGFAFNSTILWDRERWWRPTSESIIIHTSGRDGLQESRFVAKLVEDERQIEALGGNCTRIMAWSLNVEPPGLNYPLSWSLDHNLGAVTAIK